jgi:hypothetical protein
VINLHVFLYVVGCLLNCNIWYCLCLTIKTTSTLHAHYPGIFTTVLHREINTVANRWGTQLHAHIYCAFASREADTNKTDIKYLIRKVLDLVDNPFTFTHSFVIFCWATCFGLSGHHQAHVYVFKLLHCSRIWGSHGGEYEDGCLRYCTIVFI